MTAWYLYCALHLDELTVLGPKCEQHDCDGLQAGLVHWPSGATRCCERHVARWRRIAEAMGVHLVVDPIAWTPPQLDDAELRFRLMELT
jgi:hypothetical protein